MAAPLVDIVQRWSENNAFFTWLRESPSVWAYPTMFFVHTLGLIFTAGASLVVDARLLGAARRLPVAPLARVFTVIWTGVVLTVASGLLMLGTDVQTRLMNRIFPLKMALVVVAIAMTAVLGQRVAAAGDDGAVPASVRALAAISLLCWLGAVAAGKFMAYF